MPWKVYADIPSFVKGERLANSFPKIYGRGVDEYVAEWLPVMGFKELGFRLASDLGFEVKIKWNRIRVNQKRNPHYEKAFPRDLEV